MRRKEASGALLDLFSIAAEANAAVGDEPLGVLVDGRRRIVQLQMGRTAGCVVGKKAAIGLKIGQVLHGGGIAEPKMIGDQRRVFGSHPEGDERAGVAEHGPPEIIGQLASCTGAPA
jgi:hypothetical protein